MKLEAIELDVLAKDNFLPKKRTYEDKSLKILLRQLAVHNKITLEKKRMNKSIDQIKDTKGIIEFINEKIQTNQNLLTKHDIMLLTLTKLKKNKGKIEQIINETKKKTLKLKN